MNTNFVSIYDLLASLNISEMSFDSCRNWHLMPSSTICEIWSEIKLSRGINTIVVPFSVIAGSWNVRLLPPPVGTRAITSRLLLVALIISLCLILNSWFLNIFWLTVSISSSHSNPYIHSFSSLVKGFFGFTASIFGGWESLILLVGESLTLFVGESLIFESDDIIRESKGMKPVGDGLDEPIRACLREFCPRLLSF